MAVAEGRRGAGQAEEGGSRGDGQHHHQHPCNDRRGGDDVDHGRRRCVEVVIEMADGEDVPGLVAGALGLEEDIGGQGDGRVAAELDDAVAW